MWRFYLRINHLMYFARSETRFDDTFSDNQVCPKGYDIFRKDRNRNGGGCAVLVKSKWPCKRRPDLQPDCLEIVCVEICPAKAKNTIFAVTYKPPSIDGDEFVTAPEQDFLSMLESEFGKDLIVMGDFNADVIPKKKCKYTKKLLHATRLNGLSQLIKEPTRVTEHSIAP